jgi:hypothetical protein
LKPVVTDGARGVQCLLDVTFLQHRFQLRHSVRPDASEAIRL